MRASISLQRLRNYSRRPSEQRRLLLWAIVLLSGARLALSVVPNSHLRKWLGRSPRVRQPRHGDASPRAVVDAVRTAARDVRGADCFAQALAARLLLARNGHPATIRVSVGRSNEGRLVAHAWVATGGDDASFGSADLSQRVVGDTVDFEV